MPYDPLAAPNRRGPDTPRRAEHTSICPVCHIYIARDWSVSIRLPEPLPVYCRDRNGEPAFKCDDYTRSGYRRDHRIGESAWVHARCYEVGLEVFALRKKLLDRPFSAPGWTQAERQTSKEIDTLLLSARPPGSTDWRVQEDWVADHD